MKLNDNQFNDLLILIKTFINIDKGKGMDITFDSIDKYIKQGVYMSGLEIDQEDHNNIFTKIEYQFKITHTESEVIFDEYDNVEKWYDPEKITNNFFWDRYREYLVNKSSLDAKSINLMDIKTLPEIINCLGNPKKEFDGKQFRRGLIIGDVQSGKTATYIGLICKAADAGYKVVILLAGITESLRQQTQERVDEGIIGLTKKKAGKDVKTFKVGVGLDNQPVSATSFTSCTSDFVANSDKIATSLEEHKSLVLFVIKKNVSVLQKLLNWLRDFNLDEVKGYVDQPLLLIDDEADNASVNTRKDDTDPTRTNKLIRNICNLFKNSTYVGFTATPFANIFIDPDSVDSMKQADLFPKHFIYILPTPSSYIGADKIFYPEGKEHENLRYIDDIEEPDYDSQEYQDLLREDPEALNTGTFYYKHMKEWHGILPDSLHEALLCFYLANVVRDLRGKIEKPRSMLVNMSRFINVQNYIKDELEEQHRAFIATVKYDFNEDSSKNESLPLYLELKKYWKKNFSNIKDITFDRVVKKDALLSSVSKIKIVVVNGGKLSGKLDYKVNKGLRVIAVGGLALSRGLTLEGLLVSYFYRNTATFDVLMQMGRWFGYRPNYADLFRIWISRLSADWYGEVAKASQELKNDIKNMYDQRLTPKDFGIKVRNYSDELQITASNKMRNSYNWYEFSFYGNIYDTPYVSRNVKQNKENWNAVNKLATKLFEDGYDFRFADQRKQKDEDVNSDSGRSRYFADVPKEVVIDFLGKIKCSLMNVNFNTEQILDFLNDPSTQGMETWDIVFEGGDGENHYDIPGLKRIKCASRAIYPNGNVIQISSRRRLTGTREGRFTLTAEQIDEAETAQRNEWMEEGSHTLDSKSAIPLKAYFKFLPHRKPVLIIMLLEPVPQRNDNKGNSQTQKTRFDQFVEQLGTDRLVAFAIGFPGIKHLIEFKHYKANKVFYEQNMIDEPDEIEDGE